MLSSTGSRLASHLDLHSAAHSALSPDSFHRYLSELAIPGVEGIFFPSHTVVQGRGSGQPSRRDSICSCSRRQLRPTCQALVTTPHWVLVGLYPGIDRKAWKYSCLNAGLNCLISFCCGREGVLGGPMEIRCCELWYPIIDPTQGYLVVFLRLWRCITCFS